MSVSLINRRLKSSSSLESLINIISNTPEASQQEIAPYLAEEEESKMLTISFRNKMIKKGKPLDGKLANANMRLKHLLQIDNPIHKALQAVKPVLKWEVQGKKARPVIFNPKKQTNTAISWILEEAKKARSIEDGIVKEVLAIMEGKSILYQKRFIFHKNPNQ